MSHQEKTIVISLLTAIVVFAFFFFRIQQFYGDGLLQGAGASALLGKNILMAIGASIILTIIGNIVFAILHAIVTKEPKPSFVVDERDRQIEIRGNQVFFIAFCIGFVLSAVALMFATDPILVIVMIFAAMYFGSMLGDIVKLVIYRRGG